MTTDQEIRRAVRRLNARAWGVTGALVSSLGLFGATNFLILRGPTNEGQHVGGTLDLLSNFLPGYSVSFFGSIIGFVYMFVLGYILGRAVGAVYNRLVDGFPG